MPDIGPVLADNRYHLDPALPPKEALPTMYDLPSEDPEEPGLPDLFHFLQAVLLSETFLSPLAPVHRTLTAADHNLYYDPRHPLWHKRPDWFAVLEVPRQSQDGDLRLSYVVWQEGRVPSIVVELLSAGRDDEDLGLTEPRKSEGPPTKWQVYERILGVPYYVVFGRQEAFPRIFRHVNGRYRELEVGAEPVWLDGLGLALGTWTGEYQHVKQRWLRWFDGEGRMIPTNAEQAKAESARAEAAEHRIAELEAMLQRLSGKTD